MNGLPFIFGEGAKLRLYPVETLRTDSVWLQYPLPHAEVNPELVLEQCWSGCWITVTGVLKICANWGDAVWLQYALKGYWSCTEYILAKEVRVGVEPRSPQLSPILALLPSEPCSCSYLWSNEGTFYSLIDTESMLYQYWSAWGCWISPESELKIYFFNLMKNGGTESVLNQSWRSCHIT